MSTEAKDKGSPLGGDVGEGASSLLDCQPVEENLKAVLSVSLMKLDHEDILPALRTITRPCMVELNAELKKCNGLVALYMSLFKNLCSFQVDKMSYLSLCQKVTPSQFPTLLQNNNSSYNEYFTLHCCIMLLVLKQLKC